MKMRVILAGHNVDLDGLRALKKRHTILTPETISAAYARISRSPRSIEELREDARKEVSAARKSNRKIIFEMGHHSVAEHAVFNFDIIGISRRAVEEFERFRLCSFTEKSQRYVTLRGDHIVPAELRDKKLRDAFRAVIRQQNKLYCFLLEEISRRNFCEFPDLAKDDNGRRLLKNLAKEDARYVLSLATQTQVGATVNARNLELMIRRFASHRFIEVNELGKRLYALVRRVAPSILLFCAANDFDRKAYADVKAHSRKFVKDARDPDGKDVTLVGASADGDERILAALLSSTTGSDYHRCWKALKKMSSKKKLDLFKTSCRRLELYDVVPREFEYADLTYGLVVSAGCFGQLKRHRMASVVWSDLDPSLGVVVPESVKAVGAEQAFREIIGRTDELYRKIEKSAPGIGSYILTNAHCRRVLLKVNLRELYHISRLREDPTAQWDIRHIAAKMSDQARKAMPITASLLCGKSDYPAVYRRLFGRYPRVKHVPLP